MARKKKARRRRSTAISLTGLAESYILGDAVTRGLFGSSLAGFATGVTRQDGSPSGALAYNPGADGYAVTSLPELLGFRAGGWSADAIGGSYGDKSFGDMVTRNLGRNGMRSITTMVITPIAFRGFKKLASKPIRLLNKGLKGTGVRI